MATQCDVVVIGLGPGGEATATQLAQAGLSVVAVDERLVGGECPYFGCIPSKMIVRASDVLGEAGRVSGFAGTAEVQPDWAPVHARIRDEATDDWNDQVAVDRLEDAGARFVRGHAQLDGERTVVVGDERFEAKRGVVLNPGTAPSAPPIDGLADTPYWTNRDILRIESVPGSLIVIGGGAIGAELSQALSRFGVRVTVLEVADRLLAPEEPEASALIADVFAQEGIQVLTGAKIALRVVRRRPVPGRPGGPDPRRGEAARRGRPAPQPLRPRARHRRPRPVRPHRRGRRRDARRRGSLGDRRRDRQGRVHAHVDVPVRPVRARHPRPGGAVRRLPRGPAGHLHRPRGRLGRDDREAGARRRAEHPRRRTPTSPRPPPVAGSPGRRG